MMWHKNGPLPLINLGTLLSLHDPMETGATVTHKNAADGEDDSKPFDKISVESMRKEIEYEISTAGGHTIANLFRGGKGVPYREIVWDVAEHVKVNPPEVATISEVEGMVAQQVLKTMLSKLTEEQKRELDKNLSMLAAKQGKGFGKEGGALAALTAAQLSGFGIYLAASTIVGAITGILGVTLPFAFYSAMSTVIATAIGPVGWAALGIVAVYKVGSPNMKKLVPAVLMIAAKRNE